jgi:flagellin
MELSMERLSSGKRINGASDDAAGVAIASRLTAEIRGTNQAIRNAMDGQALIDTAEGAHVEIENILQRMREIAVQASNGTNDATDRSNLQTEVDNLRTEIDRIAQTTSWAGQGLLDGKATGIATSHTDTADFIFQIGSGTGAADSITTRIGAVTAAALGVGGSTSIPTVGNVVATTAGNGTGTYSASTGKLSIANTWANADTLALNVNGTDITITVSNADKYADTPKGVSQQAADEINALGLQGVSVTAADDGIVFNAGAAVGRPVVTSSVTATGASGTITESTANEIVTFGGDFNHGDTYSMTVNGVTKTITASNSDQFEDNSKGLAAQMAAAFDADMHAATDAVEAGSISATQLKLAGTSVTDNGDGTITFAQDQHPVLASLTASSGSATITAGNSTITVGGTAGSTDAVSFKINGEAISYTANNAANGFATTKTGHAAGIAHTINTNADLKAAGYSATSSAAVVTIARTNGGTAAKVDITSPTTTATGGAMTLTEGTGTNAGTFTVGGNVDNADSVTMVIDGQSVTATISTSDGFLDTVAGAAQQISQAIKDADIQGIEVTYNNNATFTLQKTGALSVTSTSAAKLSVEFIDAAIQTINSQRANLGSVSNRLDSTVSNLTNISSNLQAGRGRIEDADFAAETTNLARTQILQQASTAMLAQANASKQNVLSLLQG